MNSEIPHQVAFLDETWGLPLQWFQNVEWCKGLLRKKWFRWLASFI